MNRTKASLLACGATLSLVALVACGEGPLEIEPGALNTLPRTEESQDLGNGVTTAPTSWALTAVDTVGDAEARKTRGTFNVSFRNNTLNFVAFKYVLVFVDSSNIEVGRTAFAYGLGLGPDERREAIGNFTLHAVETIAEANRIEHLVVELMLDPS